MWNFKVTIISSQVYLVITTVMIWQNNVVKSPNVDLF